MWVVLLRYIYARCLGSYGSLDEDFVFRLFLVSNLVNGTLAAAGAALILPAEQEMVAICTGQSSGKISHFAAKT